VDLIQSHIVAYDIRMTTLYTDFDVFITG